MVPIRCNDPVVAGLLAGVLLAPIAAAGQTPGTRAAGMGEAFVAVADDATSVYWNPAGMATGAYVSFVVDFTDGEGPATGGAAPGDSEHDARFIGFTVPPLGIAYYRLAQVTAEPADPVGTPGVGREDGRRSVQALTTSHLGVTLAQSLGDFLVVAGTFKLVRGEVSQGVVTAANASGALDAADGLPRRETSQFDVDAGAMVAVEQWRLGLVARNLTTPSFSGPEPDGVAVDLDREVRLGAAWGSGWPGITGLVVSVDADLTRRQSPGGERRDLAAGTETWWLNQRLGVRGGVRVSTVGEARPVVAGGVSAAVRPGIFVEAHVARGAHEQHSWSVGARVTF